MSDLAHYHEHYACLVCTYLRPCPTGMALLEAALPSYVPPIWRTDPEGKRTWAEQKKRLGLAV